MVSYQYDAGAVPGIERPRRTAGRSVAGGPAGGGAGGGVVLRALRAGAGNRVVSRMLAVQRCGPVPCDCSAEERAEYDQAHGGQGGDGTAVQRATSADWAIRGKFHGAAGVPGTLFFDMNETTPDAAEQGKLPALATPPGDALTLKGTSSEEGPGLNAGVVNARIAAVSAGLAAAGHTGVRTPEPKPLAGAGNIDYRRARSVEVRKTGAVSPTPDCSAGPQPNDGGPAPSPFTTALARAHDIIAAARAKLAAPDATTTALVAQLFGSAPGVAATVNANLGAIDGQLTNMTPFGGTSGHQCVNTCDAACGGGATAYNSGDGASAMMTLCPVYMADPDLDSRASVLIHEGSHGTTGLTTNDQAYRWQRLITHLPPALALANADSYTALAQLLANPGSITLGPTTPDTHGVMSPVEQGQVDDAVAWVQQWLIGTNSEISSLYGVVNESRPAGAWSNTYYQATMGLIAPLFGLHAPPPVPPQANQVAIAGINDRYDHLATAVSAQLNLVKDPGAATTWAPGPGATVWFGTGFFAAAGTARSRAELLLTAIINAASDIPAARRAAYRTAVLHIVVHGAFGSP
jgi:hypothetical protein